jgi:hypothetical protein
MDYIISKNALLHKLGEALLVVIISLTILSCIPLTSLYYRNWLGHTTVDYRTLNLSFILVSLILLPIKDILLRSKESAIREVVSAVFYVVSVCVIASVLFAVFEIEINNRGISNASLLAVIVIPILMTYLWILPLFILAVQKLLIIKFRTHHPL